MEQFVSGGPGSKEYQWIKKSIGKKTKSRVSMDLKEHWKEDEKQRWTSSWTDCPPSPSGHIYFSELVWPHQVNYRNRSMPKIFLDLLDIG